MANRAIPNATPQEHSIHVKNPVAAPAQSPFCDVVGKSILKKKRNFKGISRRIPTPCIDFIQ